MFEISKRAVLPKDFRRVSLVITTNTGFEASKSPQGVSVDLGIERRRYRGSRDSDGLLEVRCFFLGVVEKVVDEKSWGKWWLRVIGSGWIRREKEFVFLLIGTMRFAAL